MTSRVHNEPSAWTHESRARALQPRPASSSRVSLFGPARLQPRGSFSDRSPEQPGGRGLTALRLQFVQLPLRAFPDRKRNLKSFAIYSASLHLRRRSVLATNRQRSI